MKRLVIVIAAALMLLGVSSTAQAATTIDFSNAPQGTHLQTGSPGCSLANGVVTCNSYDLAGVGNANAQADLATAYSATVNCRNHGGQIVEVHSQVTSVSSSTGKLSPKNGRMTVPSLTSAPAPGAADFEKQATCPNPNWKAELQPGSIALSGFTYTLTFAKFSEPCITITG